MKNIKDTKQFQSWKDKLKKRKAMQYKLKNGLIKQKESKKEKENKYRDIYITK